MPDWIWLLPPAALLLVAVGWFTARRRYKDRYRSKNASIALQRDYIRGLNFLINEQPDKAIELFTQLVEVDQDTIETHLALGNLYRRRGEVDKALRIHQNVVARPDLGVHYREHGLLELARDYQRAGMLDRAESVLLDLAQGNNLAVDALKSLLPIYEQQGDWDRAIQVQKRLSNEREPAAARRIAHYYCELAEQSLGKHETTLARQYLSQAQQTDRHVSRSWLMQARLDFMAQDWKAAMLSYRKVGELEPDRLAPELGSLQQVYGQSEQANELALDLQRWSERNPAGALNYGWWLQQLIDGVASVEAAEKRFSKQPALASLLQVWLARQGDLALSAEEGRFAKSVLARQVRYRCSECGYSSRRHYWQCPSCKTWESQLSQ